MNVNGKGELSGGYTDSILPFQDNTIGPKEAQSYNCLEVLAEQTPGMSDCLDISLVFIYYLDEQPGNRQERVFRVSARGGERMGGISSWDLQPTSLESSPCGPYMKGDPTKR